MMSTALAIASRFLAHTYGYNHSRPLQADADLRRSVLSMAFLRSDIDLPGNRNNRLLFCTVISSQMFFPCLILLCLIVYSFFIVLIKHKYLNIHFPGKNIIVLWLFADKWNCFLQLNNTTSFRIKYCEYGQKQ